jgi:hypothetical protein
VKVVANQLTENLQVKRRGLLDVAAHGLDPSGCFQSLVDSIEMFLKTAIKMFLLGCGKK